jgi:hypothetical protein
MLLALNWTTQSLTGKKTVISGSTELTLTKWSFSKPSSQLKPLLAASPYSFNSDEEEMSSLVEVLLTTYCGPSQRVPRESSWSLSQELAKLSWLADYHQRRNASLSLLSRVNKYSSSLDRNIEGWFSFTRFFIHQDLNLDHACEGQCWRGLPITLFMYL